MSRFGSLWRAATRGRVLDRLYGEEILAAMLFALCLLLLSAQQLLAHEFRVGNMVEHPSARLTPVGADGAAGYLVVRNSGATAGDAPPGRALRPSGRSSTDARRMPLTPANGWRARI